MKSHLLLAAVASLSISGLSFAQTAADQTAEQSKQSRTGVPSGAAQPGQAGQTGSTGSMDSTGTGTAGTGATEPDASGAMQSDQNRSMQRGVMGGEADSKVREQLQKIAQMPDKAPDALFALGAAKGNLYEVEFARLAQQKAQDSQVKELARMIEQDHSQANEKLKPVIQKMGLEAPSSLPAEKQQMLAVYNAMSVQDFETCYVLENKAAHAKDIVSYTDHQTSVKDPELKTYVTETLPKLREHGGHIQQVAAAKGFAGEMGGTDSGMRSGGMGERAAERQREQAPGVTPQSPDPTNPVGNQNPSNR